MSDERDVRSPKTGANRLDEVRGNGWVLGKTRDGFILHEVGVDPNLSPPGTFLRFSEGALPGLVALVDYGAVGYLPDDISEQPSKYAHIEMRFKLNDEIVYEAIGVVPNEKQIIWLPKPGTGHVVVKHIEWIFSDNGQQVAEVVCAPPPPS